MDINLSLDEIIAKSKESRKLKLKKHDRASLTKIRHKTKFKSSKKKWKATHVEDARNFIIAKARSKITDARDIIINNACKNGFDARKHITTRKQRRAISEAGILKEGRLVGSLTGTNMGRGHADYVRTSAQQYDNDNTAEVQREEYHRRAANFQCNCHLYGHDLPSRSLPPLSSLRQIAWDEARSKYFDINDNGSAAGSTSAMIKRTIVTRTEPFNDYELLHSQAAVDHSINDNKIIRPSTLSAQLRARLHSNEADPRISQGIYANENMINLTGRITTSANIQNNTANANMGYHIIVSNLHPYVSTVDIEELFSEIGPMYDARVVRPGTAEVIYKLQLHARRAVDVYHNRQLDGQRMKVSLVNPRSSNCPTAPAISSSSNDSMSTVACDIEILHSVLFGDR